MLRVLLFLALSSSAAVVSATETLAYLYTQETCPQWPSGFPIDNKGKALWSVKYNIRDHDHCFKKEYDGEKKGARRHALLVPNKREDQGDPAAGCLEMFATLDCVGASEKMPFSLQDLNANCYTFDQADHPNERAPTGYASYKFHPIDACGDPAKGSVDFTRLEKPTWDP